MRTRIYKMASVGVANSNNNASLVIQQRGFLMGIKWHAGGTAGAAVGRMTHELSFVPTEQLTANDAIGPIDYFTVGYEVALAHYGVQSLTTGLSLELRSGDRLILNNILNGTAPSAQNLTIMLYVGF